MSSSSSPPPPPSPGYTSPICVQHDDAAASPLDEGEDEDNLRRFMQKFGSKQDDFCYAGNGDESDSFSDSEGSASDDIAYLRRLQDQFLPPAAALGSPGTPPILKPIRALPSLDTDDDEDFETLRAIQRRFAHYEGVTEATNEDFLPETSNTFSADTFEQDPHNISLTVAMNEEHQELSNTGLIQPGDDAISAFPKFVKSFTDAPKSLLDNVPEPHTCLRKRVMDKEHPEEIRSNFNQEDGLHSSSARQFMSSRFPKSVQNFVHALKKNRSCQRFIREKMIEIEAKIEVNRKLKERVKCLIDFHATCKRKVGHSLCQKRDPRIRLISFRQQKSRSTVKENSKKSSALYFAPAENSQMSNYKMVMGRFPVSLRKRHWSSAEKDKLFDGVKQQCQEMLFLNSMNIESNFDGLNDSIITSTFDCAHHLFTPEILRSFVPLVNWDRLASMYLPRRSGSSCESRWLNHEDPMINCNPWTSLEDKKLLFTVQDRGLYNWIDMASMLGTNRTPFQCLARYQRSLNPHILNREWTREEDSKLCTAVETFGDNWQIVASHLDGRTSNQCSVRWRSTLLPERKRVGRWSVDEDKRLKVSIILFGAKNWKKISQFIPGRTQCQCRERWLNCLDPSLNLERWTEEEDAKLLAAIAEHGHRWSKVAACIPGRTDNQCRRRWKVLLPHEVPMLKAAQQLKRTVLISNFVGRENERPAIGPNDFTPVLSLPTTDAENNVGVVKKRSRERSNPGSNKNASRNNNLRKARNKFGRSTEEKSADSSNVISMEDAFDNLPLVSVETSDFTATGFPKRKRERSFRNKQSRMSRDKSKRDGGKNSKADVLVNSAKSAQFYLPPVPALPSTAAENACINGQRKRASRISQPKKFKSHKRKRIVDIFASSELSEAALMELPLVHVMKLISRKSRAMHENSKKP